MMEARGWFLNAECVVVRDMNSCMGTMEIKLSHTWDCLDEADEDYANHFDELVRM
jgi:hypothetical protein